MDIYTGFSQPSIAALAFTLRLHEGGYSLAATG